MAEGNFTRYSEFWPFYLREHSQSRTRALHYAGTAIGLTLLILFLVTLNWWLLLAAFVSGYLFAWIAHFFIERNRPATFRYPVWSFYSDLRMFTFAALGRLRQELIKAGVVSGPPVEKM